MKIFLAFATLSVAWAIDFGEWLYGSPVIYHGYEAPEGHMPYIVGMLFSDGSKPFVCGGSIIGDTWILTAAHCLENKLFALISYGSNNHLSNIGHIVFHNNFIMHELYKPRPHYNYDIGLIRTPRIEFSARVGRIALPKFSDRDNSMVNWSTEVCGWGLSHNTTLSKRLQCIDVDIISKLKCATLCPLDVLTSVVQDDVLCTEASTCNGDSGGPLVTRTNPPILVGVVTFGDQPCETFAAYARVAYFLEWINEKTNIPIAN